MTKQPDQVCIAHHGVNFELSRDQLIGMLGFEIGYCKKRAQALVRVCLAERLVDGFFFWRIDINRSH